MKKKVGTFLFLFLLLFGFSLTALAAPAGENGANVTAVRELNLNVPVARGWIVFTRDTPADDPVFGLYEGLNKEMLDRRFQNSDIYYNAIYAEDASREIVVTMVPSEDLFDWGDLSDEAYAEYAEEIRAADLKEITGVHGAEFFDYEMVDHPQCRWMKLRGEISNALEKIGLIEYVTIVNGQHINVSMRAFRGVITAGEEAHFDEFVRGLAFTRVDPAPFTLAAFVQSRHFWAYVLAGAASVVLVAALIVFLAVAGRRRRRKKLSREEALYRVEEQRPLSIEELPPFDAERPEEAPDEAAVTDPLPEPVCSVEEAPLTEPWNAGAENAAFADAAPPEAKLPGLSSLIEELPPFDAEPLSEAGKTDEAIG